MQQSHDLILDSIRKLGFKPEEIRILLVSHAHADHVGTLAELKKVTGAKTIVMEADIELLKSGGKSDYLFANRPDFHFEGVVADKTLKHGDEVTLGEVRLRAHLTPGHTPGCTTWETDIVVDGKKFNVVFLDGTGINKGTRFVNEPSYPGIADDHKTTFRVLESLRPDIFLSYHAESFGMENKIQKTSKLGINAWVDSQGYKKFVGKKKADFEKMLGEELRSMRPVSPRPVSPQ